MATYLILYKYTEQGIKNIKEAPKRVEAAKKAAKEAGITIKEVLRRCGRGGSGPCSPGS